MTSPHLREEDAQPSLGAGGEQSRVRVPGPGDWEPGKETPSPAPPPCPAPPPPALTLTAQPTEPRPHGLIWELGIPAPARRAVARRLPVSPMIMYLKR